MKSQKSSITKQSRHPSEGRPLFHNGYPGQVVIGTEKLPSKKDFESPKIVKGKWEVKERIPANKTLHTMMGEGHI